MTVLYAGYVYVMAGDHNEIKIGVSMVPAKRLLQVQSKFGQPLSVVAAWAHPQPYLVEREAHRLLQAHRTTGEWFSVSQNLAFEAVCRAITTTNDLLRQMRLPEEGQPTPDLPPMPALSKSTYLLGYVAPIRQASEDLQLRWLVAAGLDRDKIYIEHMLGATNARNSMLKDCRSGDLLLVWSPDVFASPYGIAEVTDAMSEKGARISYAKLDEGIQYA